MNLYNEGFTFLNGISDMSELPDDNLIYWEAHNNVFSLLFIYQMCVIFMVAIEDRPAAAQCARLCWCLTSFNILLHFISLLIWQATKKDAVNRRTVCYSRVTVTVFQHHITRFPSNYIWALNRSCHDFFLLLYFGAASVKHCCKMLIAFPCK